MRKHSRRIFRPLGRRHRAKRYMKTQWVSKGPQPFGVPLGTFPTRGKYLADRRNGFCSTSVSFRLTHSPRWKGLRGSTMRASRPAVMPQDTRSMYVGAGHRPARMLCQINPRTSMGFKAIFSMPRALSWSRVRKPHSTAMKSRPELRAVAMSTSVSPM